MYNRDMTRWLIVAGVFAVVGVLWWLAFRKGMKDPNLDSRDFRDNNIVPPM